MKTSPTFDPFAHKKKNTLRCRRFLPAVLKPPGSCCTSKMWTERPFKNSSKPWRCAMIWSTGVGPVWDDLVDELRLVCEVFKFPDGTQVTRQGSARGPARERWFWEVDGFWMMVLGRWLRLSQVYDLWLIYAFFKHVLHSLCILKWFYFSWCMGQLRTSSNLKKPRAGFFLPTCVETHYQLPAKALTSLLSPRVPWWFWGLSHTWFQESTGKQTRIEVCWFFFLGHCHDIAWLYDSGSWFFTESHDTFVWFHVLLCNLAVLT